VAKTMSSGSTCMIPVAPLESMLISSTVILGESRNERLVTLVPARL
jgi:hypothetical protein